MKTTIRQVPSKLPHADICIDELIEIEDVIKRVIADNENRTWEGFEYEIDESIRLTTHEELAEHGGSSCHFELSVVYSVLKSIQRTSVLRFYSFLEPELSFHWGGNEDRWATYAQIVQIFEARKLRTKNLVNAVPWYFPLLIGPVLGFAVSSLLYFGFRAGVPHSIESILATFVALTLLVLFGMYFWHLFRPSRVHFRYARLDFHARTQARREMLQKIALLITGAVLGSLSTIATSYLIKH